MSQDSRLVYSSDPSKDGQQNLKCPKCKEIKAACTCVEVKAPEMGKSGYKFVAVLRIEKQGRGGKTVTVIDRLPKQELFLKNLCQELKKKCGTGGTYETGGQEGLIEIQGDHREKIRSLLGAKGIQTKG
jgi:translation initiation factor 1